ncbi:DNA topoisomerase 1 [Buchnera aphidicola (Tetraneura ulmi)]|uniref:type I DNA topoisomerase n=1 Tax=Buchnera aphidicola TaxID=9 RepID=UPI0034641422
MKKSLVIVESPTKSKTINRYLGNKYLVKSCFGHIRDLPVNSLKNGKKIIRRKDKTSLLGFEKENLINKIGIDPYKDWKVIYSILPGKKKIITELKKISKEVEHIYLATDLDREGEAIAWHLKETIGENNHKFSRIIFNEITKESILKSFENPCLLNMNRVYSQQARRFMDRIVGYMISPLLWEKISRGLSAGRVQSVVVKMIVDRENLIKKFIPKKSWKIQAFINNEKNQLLKMKVTHYKKKKIKIKSFQEAENFLKKIKFSKFYISSIENSTNYQLPNPPFTTSTLQQFSNIYLGFGVNKTMLLAQKLYEAGYITYMRTDSTNISEQAIEKTRDYILNKFGELYLPKTNYKTKKKNKKKHEQGAHEGIRPTNVLINKNNLKLVENGIKELYAMIHCRFVASQIKPAKFKLQKIILESLDFELSNKYKFLVFDGWKKVMNYSVKEYKNSFFSINVGKQVNLNSIVIKEILSSSPSRFSEATLVKELENKKIGRPSTYASIISTIQNRGYVNIKNNKFYSKKMGEIVTDRLKYSFKSLMSYKFTAEMEDKLDQIDNNLINWKTVLNSFFSNFYKQFKKAIQSPKLGGMIPNKIITTKINCSKCFKKMVIRTAITGIFLSCSDYTKSKKKCKNTISLIPEKDFLQNKNKDCLTYKICHLCKSNMDLYYINFKLMLFICSNSLYCSEFLVEKNNNFKKNFFENKKVKKCNFCNSDMFLKFGKFGQFLKCSNQDCKNTKRMNGIKKNFLWIKPIVFPNLLCEKSNACFVLKSGVSGIFFAASSFPKSKETKTPFIEELIRFKNLLPKEILYLTDAPIVDSEGNKTMLRFDKKKKIQFIGSKKNGKFTSWKKYFINGKWKAQN